MSTAKTLLLFCIAALGTPIPLLHGQEGKEVDPLLTRLRGARGANNIAPLVAETEARLDARDPVAGELLFELARAWHRSNCAGKSIAALQRLADDHPDWRGIAYLGMAEVHLDQNDEEAVLSAYEKATQAKSKDTGKNLMDASNTVNEAYWRLGALLERRSEWKRALSCYESWKPRSWCGNCQASLEQSREMAIARCRFQLGEVDVALASLLDLATRVNSLAGPNHEAAILYLELATRAGRIAEASSQIRAFIQRLGADKNESRKRYAASVALAEGLARKSAADILAAVRDLDPGDTCVYSDGSGHVNCEWRAAGRFLGEMRAVSFLSERIGHGDPHAVVVGGLSGLEELIPLLEQQRAKESGETLQRIHEALDRLRKKR